MEHARLSPSNTRWPYCPGSIRECNKYSNKTSEAAIDGTGSHVLLESILKQPGNHKISSSCYLNSIIGEGHKDKPDGWLVDEERVNRIQIAIDYVNQRLSELSSDTQIIVEFKTNPGIKYNRDDWYGTCDISFWNNDFLEVIDYKDGFNYVSEKSDQLVSYAIGQINFLEQFNNVNIKTVRRTIIQPKTSKPIRFVDTSIDDIIHLGERLAEAAKETDNPNAPLIAGNHCKWCPHKLNCDARNKIAVKTINSTVIPSNMSPDQLSKANDAIPMIMSFIEAVEKITYERLESGIKIPNYLLVTGRPPHPKWSNEEEALKKLAGMRLKEKERSNSKIITPTEALKIKLTDRQKNSLEKLIIRGEGTKQLKRVLNEKLTTDEMFGVSSDTKKETPVEEKMVVQSEVIGKEISETLIEEKIKPRLVMTNKANGMTALQFKQHDSNWTDELLVQNGYALWGT